MVPEEDGFEDGDSYGDQIADNKNNKRAAKASRKDA
jgi:hypothetical protein